MKLTKRLLSLLLCAAMVLSFAPAIASHAHAATLSSYLSSCTKYASYVTVEIITPTTLMSYPCGSNVDGSSTGVATLPAGAAITATALYKNTAGEYWYEVSRYGTTCYLKGADTTMINHLAGDLSATDLLSPGSLAKGASFPISGVISSSLNEMTGISASMYWGTDLTIAPVITASDTVTNNTYDLLNSTVDYGMSFGSLATGVYTYTVNAELTSYYIDDSDALAKSVKSVIVERQRCIVTDYTNPNDITGWGVDLSSWNGTIDWSQVKDNVDFVILRTSFSTVADSKFYEYANGCEQYGIPFGAYVYSHATSVADAEAEVDFAVSMVKGYEMMQLPIFFDAEDEDLLSVSTSQLQTLTMAFAERVREHGYEAGIYTDKGWFALYYSGSEFNSLAKWLVQIDGFYGGYTNSYNGGVHFWQYGWEGSCPGIYTDLDINYCYDLLPGQTNDTTYRSKCTAYDSNLLVTTNASTSMMKYPCSSSVDSSSTNLKTVASGTQLHVTGLYKNTAGEYWYQVENGTGIGYIKANTATVDEFLYNDLGIINPTMADHLDVGQSYFLKGLVSAQHNNLSTVHAKVYSGENTSGTPAISSNYSPDKKEYFLVNSRVDRNLAFGQLTDGYYTYQVSADVENHYVSTSGSLATQKENVVVWEKTFTVGSGSTVHTCTPVTLPRVEPTCTKTGLTAGTSCSVCGEVMTAQQVIPAAGHKFSNGACSVCGAACPHTGATSKAVAATCKEPAHNVKTCVACGLVYKEYAGYGEWSTAKPSGVSEDMIQTKTQYRYADQTTITSSNATEAGYTQISKGWNEGTEGTHDYVKSWPSGFSTSSSLYTQYKTPVSDYEIENEKVVVKSESQTGYLYYHWCYTDSYYSVASQSGSYTTFHAYYSDTDPSNYNCDTSDMSYKTSSSNCSNSNWWFVTDVYTQNYTTHKPIYTHAKWDSWSAWSDTVVESSDTRKVETQTLYRAANGALGDHKYVNGVCSVCGDTIAVTAKDYYLIGYINGADYGCEGDYENMGDYKFVDGKLVATFNQDSYVFLKTTGNADWYMTKTYATGTSATFYNTTDGSTEKMLIPGGVEITFTLVENSDGTLTLSYTKAEPAVKPTVTLKGTTLSLEDEVHYNLYFTTENMTVAPEKMGLLVFNSQPTNATVTGGGQKISGATASGSMYVVQTDGIPGKDLGDTVYLVAYAQLANGNYVYSSVLPYSAKSYCFDRLEKSTNANLKALCVAILNYGAAAQEYFAATSDYTYTTLMNADLTAAQKALVKAYSSDMMDARGTVTASKAGAFGTSANGFTGRGVTMSADGIFSINYYFTTSTAVDNVTMYYWNAEDFANASTLTTANATGSKAMTATGKTNQFWADIDGIAAKDLDKTIYVCGIYTVGGTTYSTGVIAYSLGYYCVTMAQSGSAAMKPMAAATAVYGYYAKTYFGV